MLRARLNGRDCWIPISSDTPARSSEVCWANQIVRDSGGFKASLRVTRMIGARIWLTGCAESSNARWRIPGIAQQLLQIGMEAMPHRCIPLGCIPSLDVRDHGAGNFDVTLYTDCVSVSGQRAIELAARAIAAPLAQLADCNRQPTLEIGLLQAIRARARCRLDVRRLGDGFLLPAQPIATALALGPAAIDDVLRRFGIDSHQPQLAAAHNAYVGHRLAAAAPALGLDPSRIGAAAQSEATRWGSCELLARWHRQGNDLLGQLEIPVDLDSACRALIGPDGGDEPSRRKAGELFLQLASFGLAASLAYLRLVLLGSMQQRERRDSPPAPDGTDHEVAVYEDSMAERQLSESGVHPSPLASNDAPAHSARLKP